MAQLVAALSNAIQWPEDATLTLIRRRRLYQAMLGRREFRTKVPIGGTFHKILH